LGPEWGGGRWGTKDKTTTAVNATEEDMADLFEATCRGNGREGALTFHKTATRKMFLTHTHVDVSYAAPLSLSHSLSHTHTLLPTHGCTPRTHSRRMY